MSQIHTSVYRNLGLIGSMDQQKISALRQDLRQQLTGFKRVVEGASGLAQRDTESAAAISSLARLADTYAGQIDLAISSSSAETGAGAGLSVMRSADTTFAQLAQAMRLLIVHVDDLSAAVIVTAQQRARNINVLLTLIGLSAVATSVGLSWRAQKKVVTEIKSASAIAREVARGNLGLDIKSSRDDEVGDMTRALGEMSRQLSKTMYEVRRSAESMQVTSAEISEGNDDLSNRTEQAATNLQTAASSMEELTRTVSQTADAARQANQLANLSAEVAAHGGTVVAMVVGTMDGINTSSRKIADIIGVIDGIAFQTNILALNAAVEAARAGELGRGFAVVATEVRSLAGRSSQAAREIRDLIGASVDQVEAGSMQVSDAGKTMAEIVGSAQRVAEIIGQITLAASEQSAGIHHVNDSVMQLEQMTQQNAALVKQSAAAATSQREHANRLVQLVGSFRLGSDVSVDLRAQVRQVTMSLTT
ncbi:methyl-accepting chemotaxis protein [Actimicrobium antarcticum]